MAGVALGQKLVGMNKPKKPQMSSQAQRLQSAKMAAYKRMKFRQQQTAITDVSPTLQDFSALPDFETTSQRPRRGGGGGGRNSMGGMSAGDFVFNADFKNFDDDASGQILKSIKNNFSEINAWIKKITKGLLDLNTSLAIFFIVRGIRRLVLEKQTPNAWQMIWWAMSILRNIK